MGACIIHIPGLTARAAAGAAECTRCEAGKYSRTSGGWAWLACPCCVLVWVREEWGLERREGRGECVRLRKGQEEFERLTDHESVK